MKGQLGAFPFGDPFPFGFVRGSQETHIDPNQLDGLFWHVTFEDTVYRSVQNLYSTFPFPAISGGLVGAVQDFSSGASHSLVQGTGTKKGIYYAGVSNGLGGLLLDGGDDGYDMVTPIPASNWNAFMLYSVLLPSTGTAGTILGQKESGGEAGCFSVRGSHPEVLKSFVESLASGTYPLSTTEVSVLITQYDGVQFEFYTNDSSNGTTVISRTFTVNGSGFGYNAGLEHYKGYHFEHFAFLGKHDPLVRNGVKNWLKEKWL